MKVKVKVKVKGEGEGESEGEGEGGGEGEGEGDLYPPPWITGTIMTSDEMLTRLKECNQPYATRDCMHTHTHAPRDIACTHTHMILPSRYVILSTEFHGCNGVIGPAGARHFQLLKNKQYDPSAAGGGGGGGGGGGSGGGTLYPDHLYPAP